MGDVFNIYTGLYVISCLVAFGLFMYANARHGILAPVTYTLAYALFTMVIYGVNAYVSLPTARWYLGYGINDHSLRVLGLSAAVIVPALIAEVFAGASVRDRSTLQTEDIRMSPTIETAALALSTFFFLIYAWHFVKADFSNAVEYEDYMSSRSAEFYGIRDSLGSLAHAMRKPAGLLLAALLAYFWSRRLYFQVAVTFVPFAYIFLLNMIEQSKFCLVYIVVMGIAITVIGGRRISRIGLILTTIAGLTVFAVLLTTRHEQVYGLSSLGNVISGTLTREYDSAGSVFFQMLHLLGGGGKMFDDALDRSFEPSTAYRVLSFSPLFSAIDGYDNLWEPGPYYTVHFWKTKHGDIGLPYSGVAQAYHFGLAYMVVFEIIYTICLTYLQRRWISAPSSSMAICLSPYYLFVPMIFMYPVRNSFRLLLLAVALAYFVKARVEVPEARAVAA